MKNFKKFMHMHYISSELLIKFAFFFYIVFICLSVNANTSFYCDVDSTFLLNTIYSSVYSNGFIMILLCLSLLGISSSNKKFLLGIPVTNLKLYTMSILAYYLSVCFIFVIPQVVLPIYIDYPILYWQIVFEFLISIILCSVDILDTKKHKNIFAVKLLTNSIIIFLVKSITNITNKNFYNLDTTSTILLSIIAIVAFVYSNIVFKDRINNKVKKSIDGKSTIYKKRSKFISLITLNIYKIKFINLSTIFIILILIISETNNYERSISTIEKLTYAIPLLLINTLDYSKSKKLILNMPVNLTAVIVKDKLFKLLVFGTTLLFMETILYFWSPEKSYILKIAIASTFTFSITGLMSPFGHHPVVKNLLVFFGINLLIFDISLTYIYTLIILSIIFYVGNLLIYGRLNKHPEMAI